MKIRINLDDLLSILYSSSNEKKKRRIMKKYGLSYRDLETIKNALEKRTVKEIKIF